MLSQALVAQGLSPRFGVVVVDTVEQARSRRFVGSPAFVVDGQDLFASAEDLPAVACRTYRTGSGLTGLPEESELRVALRDALAK